VFQSHNGAIAADSERAAMAMLILFQSHNGAIAAHGNFFADDVVA